MLAVALMAFAPRGAEAETMTWRLQSLHPNVVDLEFYSESRRWVWPGNDRVYVLRDSRAQSFTLTCNRGEKVCFGAWVRGNASTYWGGGVDNKQPCNDCCYLCNGQQTDLRILRP